jgi:hypothetical protein
MVYDPDFLRLSSISGTTLEEALSAVRGYLKFASILWIRALGEPTLDGIIIRRWSRETASALRAFCTQYKCGEFVLRIDKHLTRWSARRGGYIVPAGHAQRIVRELSDEGMLTAMLEPASPHRDFYCLACVTIPEENKIVVEVVGPGFDTSDLVRSDLLPHERFEISVPLDPPRIAAAAGVSPIRTYVIPQEHYRRSVEDRLAKIGARLRNPAFPKDVSAQSDNLREDARHFLRMTGETLLLKHSVRYEPIPGEYLRRFVLGVLRMLSGLERHTVRLGTVTFSGTFTTRRRLVYWDFFPADTSKGQLLYS